MVGVIFALVSGQYAEIHETYSAYQQNADRDRHAAANEIARSCRNRDGVSLRDCVSDGLQTYAAEQATNQDLKAQQDMALWALAMFVVSAFGLAVTLLGIYLIYRTLIYTREAANLTQSTLDQTKRANDLVLQDQRAWLSAGAEVVGDANISSGNYHFPIRFFVKNHGRTPAFNSIIFAETFGVGDGSNVFTVQEALFERAKNVYLRSESPHTMGKTIFPGDSVPLGKAPSISIDRMNASARKGSGRATVFIVGCVFYKSQLSDQLRHTRFAYELIENGLSGMEIDLTARPPSFAKSVFAEITLQPYFTAHHAD